MGKRRRYGAEAIAYLVPEILDDQVPGHDGDDFPFEPAGPVTMTWTTRAGFQARLTVDARAFPLLRVPWPIVRDLLRAIGDELVLETDDPDDDGTT